MSGRAAWRLEAFGFSQVYRYHDGKADWLASGLPSEGRLAHLPRIDEMAHQGVPTCQLDERIGAVQSLVEETGFELCVVVNAQRVVLGVVRGKALHASPDTLVEQVMQPAPVTYRPNVTVDELAHHLEGSNVKHALVSTADGVLVGLVRRAEVARAASHTKVCRAPEGPPGNAAHEGRQSA